MTSSILLSNSGRKKAFNSSITRDFITAYVVSSVSFWVENPIVLLPFEIDVEPTFDVMTINAFLKETLSL
jgi:hypothetical protein